MNGGRNDELVLLPNPPLLKPPNAPGAKPVCAVVGGIGGGGGGGGIIFAVADDALFVVCGRCHTERIGDGQSYMHKSSGRPQSLYFVANFYKQIIKFFIPYIPDVSHSDPLHKLRQQPTTFVHCSSASIAKH